MFLYNDWLLQFQSVSSVNSDMSVTVKDNDDDSEQDDVATTQQSLIRKLQQTKFTGKLM